MNMKKARDVHLHIIVSKEERRWLDALAKDAGTSVSDVIRTVIRKEYKVCKIYDRYLSEQTKKRKA